MVIVQEHPGLYTNWRPAPEHPELRSDTLDIWLLDLQALPCREAVLDADETRRLNAFKHPDARRQFCTSHTALRGILGKYLALAPEEVAIQIAEGGKPRMPIPPPLHFNLSHAGSRALLAIGQKHDVGIDIEALRPIPGMERIARRVFSSPEIEQLAECGWPAQLFFETWSRMEARQKCLGRGVFGDAVEESRVQTRDFSLSEDCFAAVAWESGWSPEAINFYDASL